MLRRSVLARRAPDLSFLSKIGISTTEVNAGCFDGKQWKASGPVVDVISPITGKPLGGVKVQLATPADARRCIDNQLEVKKRWMETPAPKRGEIVRQIGVALREVLDPLGKLLSLEVGKISSEGIGEVVEYVDICDFAAGLSRQLPGQVLPSERPGHFFAEQWHPLGSIGIIAAFNFPIAVAGWNAAISMVCGNTQIWKSAPTTSLCGIATQRVMNTVLERHGLAQVTTFCSGGADVGQTIVKAPELQLVSFTGSTHVGREVNMQLAERFAKPLLELGGNNAMIVMDDADIEMGVRSTVFSAVGTCGQRCTTLRRLLLHRAVYDQFLARLVGIYKKLKIGDPTAAGTLVGPLHGAPSVEKFKHAVAAAVQQGGKILVGGKAFGENNPAVPGPWYVEPTIIEVTPDMPIVQTETFAPILYVMKIDSLQQGIDINNSVDVGLSSSIITNSVRNAFAFASPCGSDCGIVNVNCAVNGAEIGGSFGGNKATGWGRESGSNAWQQYMRRANTTLNYSTELPLAQGVSFDVDAEAADGAGCVVRK